MSYAIKAAPVSIYVFKQIDSEMGMWVGAICHKGEELHRTCNAHYSPGEAYAKAEEMLGIVEERLLEEGKIETVTDLHPPIRVRKNTVGLSLAEISAGVIAWDREMAKFDGHRQTHFRRYGKEEGIERFEAVPYNEEGRDKAAEIIVEERV